LGEKADRVLQILIEKQEASEKTDQAMAESFGWKNGKSWQHMRMSRVPINRMFLAQVLAAYPTMGHWVTEAIVEVAIECGAQVPGAAR